MMTDHLSLEEGKGCQLICPEWSGSPRSPLKDLIPIEPEASPSQDKGKGKEKAEMDKGKPKRACSQSLTVSEHASAFHGGEDSCFAYSWIDNEHGDSFSNQDIKESKWLTNRSFVDASKGDLTE